MKRFIFILLLLLPAVFALGQTYCAVSDSFAVTTTPVDSIFSVRWMECNIKATVPVLIKVAYSSLDTTGFWPGTEAGVKQYIRLEAYEVYEIDRDSNVPGLYRLRIRAVSDAGTAYLDGTKKTYR